MKQRTIFLALCMFLTSCLPAMSPQMMMPTEEELAKMNQEIEAFRASMTQEQRDEFDKQVEELANVMKDMPEEELNKFIETVFNEGSIEPIPQPAPAPVAPVKETKPEEPLYKPSTVSTKTIGSTKSMIGAILSHTESFLRKASLIPDLYGPINAWVPVAILADKKDLAWQELKQDIERLISSLKVALATDPATGHYYYLTSLIENDALYQNIIRLHDALVRNEPSVQVTAFGLGDLTKESRKATEAVLSAFAQAISAQQMIIEIQKLFSAFEPQAKKVMEQEESARKRAIEESKKIPTQSAMRSGGTLVDDYSSSTGYKPGASDTYGYGSPAYIPPTTPYSTSFDQPSTIGESRSTPKTSQMSQPAPSASDKKEAEDVAKKQKADAAKSDAATPDKKASDTAEKITEKIAGFLEDCIIGIKAKKLDITVMDDDKQEAVDEAAGRIARIISRIKTLENVTKDFTGAQKDVYMDQIKIMVKEEKDLFNTIISATDADKNNELRKQIEVLFKKLDIAHTKKTIKPRPAITKPAAQTTIQAPVKSPVQTPRRLTPQRRSPTTAEIHPAAMQPHMTPDELQTLNQEIEEPLVDLHPAALQPASADMDIVD